MSNAIEMNTKKIDGGYIILSRKIIESDIWDKPPLYIKVWIYLLARAQHKDFKQLKRGELWVSINEIQEACSWYVGYRKETPSRKQIFSILDWLRFPYEGSAKGMTNGTMKGSMIETTKATRGMLVKIVNYNTYQNPKNYEGNDEWNNEGNDEELAKEQRRQRQGNRINKNVKNDNNDNKYSLTREDVDRVILAWNSFAQNKIHKISPNSTRYTHLRKRVEENGLGEVLRAIKMTSESDFMQGKNNNGWVATFDWLMKPSNFQKTLEGNYRNKKKPEMSNIEEGLKILMNA